MDHEGTDQLATEIGRQRRAVRLVQRNRRELLLFIEFLSHPQIALNTMDRRYPWQWREAMEEVGYLLHDFVSAAVTLQDLTRATYKRLYRPHGQIAGFQAEIDRRFKNDPLAQFVKKLRHMTVHHSLPNVASAVDIQGPSNDATFTTRYYLPVEDLRRYNEWGAVATKYLDAAGESIDLVEVVQEYGDSVADFDRWFRREQVLAHGIQPEIFLLEVKGTAGKEGSAMVTDFASAITALPDDPKDITPQTIRDVYDPLLNVLDTRHLRLFHHDPPRWLELAHLAVKRRFTIPRHVDEKVAALLVAARQPPTGTS